MAEEFVYRPDMRDFGAYIRWPEPGDAWYHADDAAIVAELIPSNRVLKRLCFDGVYYHLSYGAKRLRVLPTMWHNVPTIDLEIGQGVEILASYGQNEPGIGFVTDICYDTHAACVRFFIRRGDMRCPVPYERHDLRPLDVKYHLRIGYYPHEPPRCDPSWLADWLNVGHLTD